MTITEADIQAFAEFAREQTADGGENLTMPELVAKWEATRARQAANSAIRESLVDIESGRTEPFFESQEKFRRDRNLPAPQ